MSKLLLGGARLDGWSDFRATETDLSASARQVGTGPNSVAVKPVVIVSFQGKNLSVSYAQAIDLARALLETATDAAQCAARLEENLKW